MSRSSRGVVAAAAVAFAATAAVPLAGLGPASAGEYPSTFTHTQPEQQPEGYGPSKPFIDKIMPWHGPVEPMKDQARIDRTDYGYRYTTGQQDNHLTITEVTGGIQFSDTATKELKALPKGCEAGQVTVGVVVTCEVPATTSAVDPMLIEVHPRLGDDYVDGRTLSARFDMSVLGDAGAERIWTGAGNDFVNGAFDRDIVRGGDGNDWLRTGTENDDVYGGPGNDWLVGAEHHDRVFGRAGDDRVGGGKGDDLLYTGRGVDLAAGDTGSDTAYIDGDDRANNVEKVIHR
jgi:serralysin